MVHKAKKSSLWRYPSKDNKEKEAILGFRREHRSSKWKTIKGHFMLMTSEIHDKVLEAEAETAAKKSKWGLSVTVAPKRTTNVSVTKRPCDHGVKPPCPPCSSTNLTNIATSPCPPCSLTNIANMVTSHCPPCSLTNSTVITTIMYGTKIMYLNPESLLR